MKPYLMGVKVFFMTFLLISLSYGQVSFPINPLSKSHQLRPLGSEIILPAYDNDSLDGKYNQHSTFTSNTFGVDIPTNIDLCQYGQWDTLLNGMLVWRLHISSPTATGFKTIFDLFRLPKTGRLFFYSPDHQQTLGAFTDFHNQEHLQFATRTFVGNSMTIEYNVAASEVDQTLFRISDFTYVFTDGIHIGNAADCQNDVTCTPWPYPSEQPHLASLATQ